jgi:hypothetical protein
MKAIRPGRLSGKKKAIQRPIIQLRGKRPGEGGGFCTIQIEGSGGGGNGTTLPDLTGT